ncbi:hypothetical protein C8R46DRAFT_1218227 [Mycena filopes]|nr:hypothetical protein C8R46DRAFT_1218227 [Mycena filopes]
MSLLPTTPSQIVLLTPMPIPRTPNAPYFDERGVRTFLQLILQHGLNAGITDADELVTFIVRYSSDRVREVIKYIPELDDDVPNRTWKSAQQQMLLLYGSDDEDRRTTERELIEFCQEQSATSPFRTKVEVEQYLRRFQYIAAPLLKQREITTAQRDVYFVSGIPSAIKDWFFSRVPESQRTRSNPIPFTDSVDILYSHFDPDTLCPDVWGYLHHSAERPASPPASTAPTYSPPDPHASAMRPNVSFECAPAEPAPISTTLPHEDYRSLSPSPTPSPLELETEETPYIEEIDPNFDDAADYSSPVEEEFKVPPLP